MPPNPKFWEKTFSDSQQFSSDWKIVLDVLQTYIQEREIYADIKVLALVNKLLEATDSNYASISWVLTDLINLKYQIPGLARTVAFYIFAKFCNRMVEQGLKDILILLSPERVNSTSLTSSLKRMQEFIALHSWIEFGKPVAEQLAQLFPTATDTTES